MPQLRCDGRRVRRVDCFASVSACAACPLASPGWESKRAYLERRTYHHSEEEKQKKGTTVRRR